MHTNIISVIVLINIPQKLVVIRENPITIGQNERTGERRRSRVSVVDSVFVFIFISDVHEHLSLLLVNVIVSVGHKLSWPLTMRVLSQHWDLIG